MTTHRISLQSGWYQVDETCADGSVTPIGNFRTEIDAREWLDTYLRMQTQRIRTEAEVFKVGSSLLPTAAPMSIEAAGPAPGQIEQSVTAWASH